jgi:hypothetical protein
MTRLRWILLVTVGAAIAAGATSAAGSTNPKRLLLRASDMPAGAERVTFGGSTGSIEIPRKIHGKAAYVAYKFEKGSRQESVGEAVGTFTSTHDAHAVFANLRRKASSEVALPPIKVKRFGNEQFARGSAKSAFSLGMLVVRSRSVIWEIVVGASPGLSKARLVSELQKYAAKAKARAT